MTENEDKAPYPYVTWQVLRAELGFTAEEEEDIHRIVRRIKYVPYCLNCGDDVDNRGIASMSGPGRDHWVHSSTGYPSCRPGQKLSPVATPVFPERVK